MAKLTKAQEAALAKGRAKPGDVRNPTGINGWSKLRDDYRFRLAKDVETITDVLLAHAKAGDMNAVRLALGPILDVRAIELSNPDGSALNFAALADSARASKANGEDLSPPQEREESGADAPRGAGEAGGSGSRGG